MFAAGLSCLAEIKKDPRCSVHTLACGERRLDQPKQTLVFYRPIGLRLLQPRVVATSGNTQKTAHHPDIVLVAVRLYVLVLTSNALIVLPSGHLIPLHIVLVIYSVHETLVTPIGQDRTVNQQPLLFVETLLLARRRI